MVDALQTIIRGQMGVQFNSLRADKLDLRQVHPIINRRMQRGGNVSRFPPQMLLISA
ncbi:16701_t:CDS:1, partial [Acaulospora colombiana]